MKLLFKFALILALPFVAACWAISALASRVYGIAHGFLWLILLIPAAFAAITHLWSQAISLLVLAALSWLVLLILSFADVALKCLIGNIISTIML